MKSPPRLMALPLAASLAAGCATYPTGPSVTALPGTQSSFDQFRADDLNCRLYARQAAGLPPEQAASNAAINSATVGTMVGAAAGALLGAAGGNAGTGAALGAGTGLLFGSAAGAEAGSQSGRSAQEMLDQAYVQCMYGKGHQVPVPASVAARMQQQSAARVAPPVYVQPPAQAPVAPSYPPPNAPPPPGY